jgi:hypothetical protein
VSVEVRFLPESAEYPEGFELLYEAEWNEEADADQHMDAVLWFARNKDVPEEEVQRAAEALDWTTAETTAWFAVYRR